jgi:hypothetical protein
MPKFKYAKFGLFAFIGILVWQINKNSVEPGLGLMRIRPVVSATDANAKPFLDPAGNEVWLGPQRLFALDEVHATSDGSGQPAIGYEVASIDRKNFRSYLLDLSGEPFAVLHNDQVICLPDPPGEFSSSGALVSGAQAWTEEQADSFTNGLADGLRKVGTDLEPVGAVHMHVVDGSFEEYSERLEDLAFTGEIKPHRIPIRKMWLEDDYVEGLLIKLEPTTTGMKTIIESCRADEGQGIILTASLSQWYLPPMGALQEIQLEVMEDSGMPPTRTAIHLMRGIVADGQAGHD